MTKRRLKNALYATLVMAVFFGLIGLMTWLTENHWVIMKYVAVGVLISVIWVMIYGMVSLTNKD